MKGLLLVMVGGGLGAGLRYLTGMGMGAWMGREWPWGTLMANMLGCLLIGVLAGKLGGESEARLFWVTGFCGGYTTFSSFGLEALGLMERGEGLSGLVYVVGTLVCTFGGVMIGRMIG